MCARRRSRSSGHAVECRVNAEDPDRDFLPGPGTVRPAVFPAGEGIRVDTALQAGTVVPPYYDSLVAKVIAVGPDRDAALHMMTEALGRCRIDGIPTTSRCTRLSSPAPSSGPAASIPAGSPLARLARPPRDNGSGAS